MPYWASSRVGIVPQGQSASKQKKRNERSNRKKGITMEDLKKQTALRLAQEQKERQGRGSSSTTSSSRVVEAKQTPQRNVVTAPAGNSSTDFTVHGTSPSLTASSSSSSTTAAYPVRTAEQVAYVQTPHTPDNASRFPFRHGQPVHKRNEGSVAATAQPSSVRSQEPAPSNHQTHSVASVHSQPPCTSNDMASQVAKSKLPHGLTVHELKEMTKARLQAEAAEKRDTTEPLATVPSTVRVSTDFRETTRSPHMTPTGSQGFHNPPMNVYAENTEYINLSQSRDAWTQDARADAWETASVSTATSDFYGSESAYSNGVGGVSSADEQLGPSFVGPSRSFSANNAIGGSHEAMMHYDGSAPQMAVSSSSFYEASSSFTPNRHRAVTLSPRVGLSHLHEDRPFLSTQGLPGAPTFPSPSAGRLTPRSRSSLMPEPFSYGQVTDFPAGRVEGNRARTSSTASLPAISTTADEFALDQGARYPPHIGILPENSPGPSVTGLSNVFREAPQDVMAPPGFHGGELGGSRSMGLNAMDTFRESRIRASTWSEPSHDRLGPSLFGHSHDDDAIVDGLASILKLSGAEESGGESSFFSPSGL